MRTPTIALLVAGCGRDSRRARAPRRCRGRGASGIAPWIAGIGAVAVFFLVYAGIFDLPFHTTASLGNNDASSYTIIGQHLADHGFGDSGQVPGIANTARDDAFGSTVVLGAASAATGIDVWKLATPVMFIFVVLGAVDARAVAAGAVPGRAGAERARGGGGVCGLSVLLHRRRSTSWGRSWRWR